MTKTFSTKVKLERLEKALESLQEKYDTLKNDKKKEVSQLKKQRRRLKAKISKLSKDLSSKADISIEEIENLKCSKCGGYIDEVEVQLYTARKELAEIRGFAKGCNKDSNEWYNNVLRLYFFYIGQPDITNDDSLFFDYRTLIITFNPLNGSRITPIEYSKIMDILKSYDNYKNALEEFSSYKDESELTQEAVNSLYAWGEAFLKTYIQVFTGYEFLDYRGE